MNSLAAFVALLGFKTKGGDGPRLEAGQADGLPGLFAIAVNAILDAPQGFIDF